MKKLKIGFGEGGFKGFMARHVEKCVLVGVILLMFWFIYSGAGSSGATVAKGDLEKKARDAETKITNSRWDAVAAERTPRTKVGDIVVRETGKIDSRAYATKTWDHPLVPRLAPRLDPKIIAAEKVFATAVRGPLVLMPPETEDGELPKDPLDKYKVVLSGAMGGNLYEEEDEEEEKKPRGRKSREKESSSPMGPMGSMGPPPGGSASGPKSRNKKGDDPYAMPGPGSPMGSGAMMGGGSQTRSIPPEAMIGVKASAGSVLQPRTAMVVTAVVPYSKQWDAYRAAFKDAPGGQDPMRDVPNYLAVWAQVLDVTDDPSIDPATAEGWTPVKNSVELATLERNYGAQVSELVDFDATDPKLTHPVPPFLLTDLLPVLLHPDIERATAVVEKYEDDWELDAFETDDGHFLLDDDNSGGGQGAPGMSPRGGSSMGPRGSMGPPGGSSMGPRGGMSPRGSMGPAPGGSSMGPRGGSAMGPRSGGGRSTGMGAGMGGQSFGGMNFETFRPVPKKLVRFVDFDAKPGRKYRYRLQLALEDPNRPRDPEMDPDPNTLDEEVRVRIKPLEAAEAKSGSDKRRYFYITSDWSEPSNIVSVPSSEKFYAGETVPATVLNNIAGATVPTGEPAAKVLTVVWDSKLGVFAPAEQVVHRASVLNTKADVEVLHPVLGDLRKIENYELSTDGVVLDILGGDKLFSPDSKEIIRAPGETLILDAEGNLVVTDEARDIEGYRKYIFPEPKVEKPKKDDSDSAGSSLGPMGSMGPSPMGGTGKGPPGYPSGTGSKRPGRPGR